MAVEVRALMSGYIPYFYVGAITCPKLDDGLANICPQ